MKYSRKLGSVMIVAIATTAIRNIKASSPLDWLSDFISSGSALSRHPDVAVPVGARMVQRGSFNSVPNSSLTRSFKFT